MLGFTHHDLHDENVMIQGLHQLGEMSPLSNHAVITYPIWQEDLSFDGRLTMNHPAVPDAKIISVRSMFVAVIIDFGKSRTDKHQPNEPIDKVYSDIEDVYNFMTGVSRLDESEHFAVVFNQKLRGHVRARPRPGKEHEYVPLGEDFIERDYTEQLKPLNFIKELLGVYPREMQDILFRSEEADLVIPNDRVTNEVLTVCRDTATPKQQNLPSCKSTT
jgi:hypothetical protein